MGSGDDGATNVHRSVDLDGRGAAVLGTELDSAGDRIGLTVKVANASVNDAALDIVIAADELQSARRRSVMHTEHSVFKNSTRFNCGFVLSDCFFIHGPTAFQPGPGSCGMSR